MRLSHSKCQAFLTCPKLYDHQYNDNWQRRSSNIPLILGRAFHAFMERYRADVPSPWGCIKDVFDSADKSLFAQKELDDVETERVRCEAMAQSYVKAYRNHDEIEFKQYITEKKLELDFEGHTYVCVIDCLAQDQAGMWWILETKTASKRARGEEFDDWLKMEHQTLGQAYAAKHFIGTYPVGVIYDTVFKTKHRQKKPTESLNDFRERLRTLYLEKYDVEGLFERRRLTLGLNRIEQWKFETLQIVKMMDGGWYPKNTGSCYKWMSPCGFMDLCTNGIANPMIYKQKEK